MIKKICFLFYMGLSSFCFAQEICDNGIDDDGNGLIDLNDEACICSTLLPSSLIPNPSFEERTCCPTMNARLDCAVGWIQASNATTDYVHTCDNYLGNTSIPAYAPLPFPDGEGAVGFRDGQSNAGSNYKEYVGACLTEAMEIGTSYRLQFYVGFRDNVQGNTSLEIAIFGSDNCNRLPFGNGSTTIGCPANTGFYDELNTQIVSGSNEWVLVTFEFIPSKPYEVIIVGSSCAPNPNFIYDPYFYLDGITLAESSEFGVPLDGVSGNICNNDLILSIEEEEGKTYQWYKDGIAIPGATGAQLQLVNSPNAGGDYLVIINFEDGCISSKSYNVRLPPYYSSWTANICENDEFVVGTNVFDQAGEYEITIQAQDGCDSIITLTINVDPNTNTILEDSFCEDELYTLLDINTDQPGTYQSILENSYGCDSVVTITLTEIPKSEGIEVPSEFQVYLGEVVNIIPEDYDPNLITFNWYNSEGDLLTNSLALNNITPLENETLTLVGEDSFGCTTEETISIRVDKSSTTLLIPNIFSPDNNNINDFFSFMPTKAVQSVESFLIYDRWGNQVYNATPMQNFNDHLGWDGTYNGKEVTQGVYGYYIKAIFIDGSEKVFTGNLTLIR